MIKKPALRRLLTMARLALGNACLLAIMLLSTGPVMASDSVEATGSPSQSKEASTESVISIQNHRPSRIRVHGFSAGLLPLSYGYVPLVRQSLVPIIGHTLSAELLAPLRC